MVAAFHITNNLCLIFLQNVSPRFTKLMKFYTLFGILKRFFQFQSSLIISYHLFLETNNRLENQLQFYLLMVKLTNFFKFSNLMHAVKHIQTPFK